MPSLRRRLTLIRHGLSIDSQMRRLPNMFTRLIGESEGGMQWKSYLHLDSHNIREREGWKCVSERVTRALAGQEIIPNPFLKFDDSPLEPGLLLLNRARSLAKVLKCSKTETIATELIWDFYPKWAIDSRNFNPMGTRTIESDPNFEFTHTCSFRPYRYGYEKKSVYIHVQGKTVKELENIDDLKKRVLNFDGIERSLMNFDDNWISIVDKVYYVDRLELRVNFDGEDKLIRIEESEFPVGFTIRRAYIGLDTFEARIIEYITNKSYKSMRSSWLRRSIFWPYFRRAIVNDEKYGMSAGDSTGRTINAFLTNILQPRRPDAELG